MIYLVVLAIALAVGCVALAFALSEALWWKTFYKSQCEDLDRRLSETTRRWIESAEADLRGVSELAEKMKIL